MWNSKKYFNLTCQVCQNFSFSSNLKNILLTIQHSGHYKLKKWRQFKSIFLKYTFLSLWVIDTPYHKLIMIWTFGVWFIMTDEKLEHFLNAFEGPSIMILLPIWLELLDEDSLFSRTTINHISKKIFWVESGQIWKSLLKEKCLLHHITFQSFLATYFANPNVVLFCCIP